MNSIEQQLRASRDKLRARQDWRPGTWQLPLMIGNSRQETFSNAHRIINAVQAVDDIIYRMMGDKQ